MARDFYDVITTFEAALRNAQVTFIDNILPAVGLFAGVIVSIYIGYKVMRSWTGESEKLDAATLLRPCLILASLALYRPLVTLLMETPIGIVNDIILAGADATTGIPRANFAQTIQNTLTFSQTTGGPDGGGINDVLQVHPFLEFINLFVFFLAYIAGGYILFRQLIVKTIYFMLGPFALAFSLIVGNERTITGWFQGYISVLLWLPVLSLIQTIIALIPLQDPNNLFSTKDVVFSMVVQIVMVLAVLKVPQYANILVTQGSSMGQQSGGTMSSMMKYKAQGKFDKMRGKGSGKGSSVPEHQR